MSWGSLVLWPALLCWLLFVSSPVLTKASDLDWGLHICFINRIIFEAGDSHQEEGLGHGQRLCGTGEWGGQQSRETPLAGAHPGEALGKARLGDGWETRGHSKKVEQPGSRRWKLAEAREVTAAEAGGLRSPGPVYLALWMSTCPAGKGKPAEPTGASAAAQPPLPLPQGAGRSWGSGG